MPFLANDFHASSSQSPQQLSQSRYTMAICYRKAFANTVRLKGDGKLFSPIVHLATFVHADVHRRKDEAAPARDALRGETYAKVEIKPSLRDRRTLSWV